MKILVFSDSHGRPDLMLAAAELERPDHVFFLGDGLRDLDLLASLQPRLPINAVRGNCDWGEDQPLTRLVELAGFRFFLTHGHMQGVGSAAFSSVAVSARADAAPATANPVPAAPAAWMNERREIVLMRLPFPWFA